MLMILFAFIHGQNGCDSSIFDVGGSKAYTFTQVIKILQGSFIGMTLLYVPKRLAMIGARLFSN